MRENIYTRGIISPLAKGLHHECITVAPLGYVQIPRAIPFSDTRHTPRRDSNYCSVSMSVPIRIIRARTPQHIIRILSAQNWGIASAVAWFGFQHMPRPELGRVLHLPFHKVGVPIRTELVRSSVHARSRCPLAQLPVLLFGLPIPQQFLPS